MSLPDLWFLIVAVFWSGYFVLEGFDFGVGMLLPVLSRRESDTDEMLESIGPVWDGNEVWLVIAGAATFAAFPAWYGTMFSGLYIALLLVLVLLMIRVVSFEWRGKARTARGRAALTWANTIGSVGAPVIWGVGLANLLYGMPLDGNGDATGNFLDLFNGYTLLAGIATVLLFAFHGATYLTLRMSGELCQRAANAARRLSVPAAVVAAAFLAATVAVAVDHNERGALGPAIPAALGGVVLALAVIFTYRRRSGWAFAMTALAAVALVATLFTGLYPRVIVSDPDFSNSLTVSGTASAHYTLKVMTIAAAIFTPIILLYTSWSYHVFRARVTGAPPVSGPAEALARKAAAPE